MEIICTKKEVAKLVITCDSAGCGNCVLEAYCESEARKLDDADKQEGFISMCKIKEGSSC